MSDKIQKIALVGNQNSGKTTLFNLLTGMNQKVGNWPGVTLERKSGKLKGTTIEIVDLPGIYSLSPYTSEEEVSRNFVLHENPDLIVNIIDATSIERSLYLTTQLLELDANVVVALNMSDMLEKKGLTIDIEKLSSLLGVCVINISALKKQGIDNLIDSINKNVGAVREKKLIFDENIEKEVAHIEKTISDSNKRFLAIKMLECDKKIKSDAPDIVLDSIGKVEKYFQTDAEEGFASARYTYIEKLKKQTVKVATRKKTITDKLDKVFLNKWAALPIFAGIMFLIYFLSVGLVGTLTVESVEGAIETFSQWFSNTLGSWGASEWSVSLVIDGIVAGVGAILTFVPQLIILFLCLSILEATGYMSRISFFLDKVFRRFGLSGKSLIPFIVGSGCSVPGIMASRTIEDPSEREMTVVLTPFVPCSAKLPIIALFAGYFFPKTAGFVSASIYFLAILLILLVAVMLKKFVYKSEHSTYISELPEYKAPSFRYVLRDVTSKTGSFIARAGTVILLCSVVIWVLLSFNWKFEYGVDVENSMLAGIGNAFAWLFYPMLGKWSWGASVSAIQGLVAKEQVVSSMEVIAGMAEGAGGNLFNGGIFSFFTGASAYAFMVFNMFSAPCFAAIGAMKKEFGCTKKMLLAVGFQTVLAFLLSYIVYGVGLLVEVIS